jgi:5-methylcytosine-specific restriction endonuclease McrA
VSKWQIIQWRKGDGIPMNIWRLNVRETQIQSCIRHKKFAIAVKPRSPEIDKGDYLLLQLVASDASRLSKRNSRIEFALIFDHYEYDPDGSKSRLYWPDADKTWPWIMHCSDIIPTVPFSLENLRLEKNYGGQTNPLYIRPRDFEKVLPFILRFGKLEEIGKRVHTALESEPVQRNYKLWTLIQNNDRIVEDSPDQVTWRIVPEHKEIQRNPELPVLLKELYAHKCQICEHDFKPRYGRPYSETHHVIWLSRGGVDHSNNLIVVCPNHHRIIHETNPEFDRKGLTFVYPNGLREHLLLKEHLKEAKLLNDIILWSQNRLSLIEKEKGFAQSR